MRLVNLSNGAYLLFAILVSYRSERGGQQSIWTLRCEDRWLVYLRCLRFGCLCLWPKFESVLNSDEDSLSVLVVDVLELLLEGGKLVVSLPAGRSSLLARSVSSPRIVLAAAGSALSDRTTVAVQTAQLV